VQENACLYSERFKRYTSMRILGKGRGRVGRLVRRPGGPPCQNIKGRSEMEKGTQGPYVWTLGSTLFSRGPEFSVTHYLWEWSA